VLAYLYNVIIIRYISVSNTIANIHSGSKAEWISDRSKIKTNEAETDVKMDIHSMGDKANLSKHVRSYNSL